MWMVERGIRLVNVSLIQVFPLQYLSLVCGGVGCGITVQRGGEVPGGVLVSDPCLGIWKHKIPTLKLMQ